MLNDLVFKFNFCLVVYIGGVIELEMNKIVVIILKLIIFIL